MPLAPAVSKGSKHPGTQVTKSLLQGSEVSIDVTTLSGMVVQLAIYPKDQVSYRLNRASGLVSWNASCVSNLTDESLLKR